MLKMTNKPSIFASVSQSHSTAQIARRISTGILRHLVFASSRAPSSIELNFTANVKLNTGRGLLPITQKEISVNYQRHDALFHNDPAKIITCVTYCFPALSVDESSVTFRHAFSRTLRCVDGLSESSIITVLPVFSFCFFMKTAKKI